MEISLFSCGSGSMPNKKNPNGPSLYCAVIVKVDEKTRSKHQLMIY